VLVKGTTWMAAETQTSAQIPQVTQMSASMTT
jgi:hypothetical protein